MRLALLLTLLCSGPLAAQSPSPGQRALIERGYGMFIHFGINTFNQTEWSDGTLPVASYHPTALDCDQWIRTAKEAGFRHVVLTTKHHDGFCLWDSAFTDYDVASSPVKTDVIAEVAKACRKYHVQLGLYYSLWDRHEPSYREQNPAAYVDYMKKQLTELLTNYGDICELWFDGGWARPAAEWHIPELYAHIKSLQPNCQITSNLTISSAADPGYAPLASEQQQGDPIRFFPADFRTKDPSLARRGDPKLFNGPDQLLHYLPYEHTIVLSDRWNWFQKKDDTPARGIDELEELFYWCTAQNNAFLLNVPPDQDGKLRDGDIKAVLDLADRLHIRGGDKPLPAGPIDQAADAHAEADSTFDDAHTAAMAVDPILDETRWAAKDNTASITLTPAKPFHFDRVVIHEYAEMKELGDGFSQQRDYRVQSFTLESLNDGKWSTIHTGETIGATKILRFPEKLTAEKLRLHLKSDNLAPSITDIAVEDSSTASLRQSP
jgi:alpha-L-fucosidase